MISSSVTRPPEIANSRNSSIESRASAIVPVVTPTRIARSRLSEARRAPRLRAISSSSDVISSMKSMSRWLGSCGARNRKASASPFSSPLGLCAFAANVRVQAPQPVEARMAQARAILRRQHDLGRVANDDVGDVAFAVNQHAHLPADFVRDFGQLAREFRRDDLDRRDATLINLLQPPQLIRFQPQCLAFDLRNSLDSFLEKYPRPNNGAR